jgi:hypothetical protein
MTLLSILPCVRATGPFACFVATAGVFRAYSSDVTVPAADSAVYVAAGLRAGWELVVAQPFSLRAHLEVLATGTPHELDVNGQGVYSLPIVSGAAGVEGVVRFR